MLFSTSYPFWAAPPAPAVSALVASSTTSTAATELTHPPHYHHLAVQVLHNLQYQHDWTSLQIHTHSPIPHPSQPSLLPRPLISGLPPRRIYVHPDEQVEMLQAGLKEEDVPVEKEWVLPTHLKEKWSLRRFAQVFDAVDETLPAGEVDQGDANDYRRKCVHANKGEKSKIENDTESRGGRADKRQWADKTRRGGQRLLLATISDDSTIVYYIVHDGLVKPRQN